MLSSRECSLDWLVSYSDWLSLAAKTERLNDSLWLSERLTDSLEILSATESLNDSESLTEPVSLTLSELDLLAVADSVSLVLLLSLGVALWLPEPLTLSELDSLAVVDSVSLVVSLSLGLVLWVSEPLTLSKSLVDTDSLIALLALSELLFEILSLKLYEADSIAEVEALWLVLIEIEPDVETLQKNTLD